VSPVSGHVAYAGEGGTVAVAPPEFQHRLRHPRPPHTVVSSMLSLATISQEVSQLGPSGLLQWDGGGRVVWEGVAHSGGPLFRTAELVWSNWSAALPQAGGGLLWGWAPFLLFQEANWSAALPQQAGGGLLWGWWLPTLPRG